MKTSFRKHTWKKKVAWLTWPKNKNGRRKVKPLHIQDWKPSAGQTTVKRSYPQAHGAADGSEQLLKRPSADRLSGPWCGVLPAFAVGTNSRSGSSTAETEQNLQARKVSASIGQSESKVRQRLEQEEAPYFGRCSRI